MQIWQNTISALDEAATDLGGVTLTAVDMPTKVEANIVDLNLLKKSQIKGPCHECQVQCDQNDSVMCGSCGLICHRKCSKPRAKRTYWYC